MEMVLAPRPGADTSKEPEKRETSVKEGVDAMSGKMKRNKRLQEKFLQQIT
jgi:hypothetical protein